MRPVFFVDVLQFWNRSHSQPNIIPEVFSYHLKKAAAVSLEFTWKLQISSDCKIYIEYTWILLLHHSACWELCLIPSKLSKVCRDLKLHRLSQGPSESNWLASAVVQGVFLEEATTKVADPHGDLPQDVWVAQYCLRFFVTSHPGYRLATIAAPNSWFHILATQGDLHGSFYPHGRVPARALV